MAQYITSGIQMHWIVFLYNRSDEYIFCVYTLKHKVL